MVQDVSGFGAVVTLVADTTFPAGISITQFSDDADPVDFAAIDIADKAMGVNGDLIVWARANPLPMVLNVIPGSDDDINLSILAEANRVGQGKSGAFDNITATAIYPDGRQITLSSGKIVNAMFGNSISSSGRQKTKSFAFSFQNKTGV